MVADLTLTACNWLYAGGSFPTDGPRTNVRWMRAGRVGHAATAALDADARSAAAGATRYGHHRQWRIAQYFDPGWIYHDGLRNHSKLPRNRLFAGGSDLCDFLRRWRNLCSARS